MRCHSSAVVGVLELVVNQNLLGEVGFHLGICPLHVLVVRKVVHHSRLFRMDGPLVVMDILRREFGGHDLLGIPLLHHVRLLLLLLLLNVSILIVVNQVLGLLAVHFGHVCGLVSFVVDIGGARLVEKAVLFALRNISPLVHYMRNACHPHIATSLDQRSYLMLIPRVLLSIKLPSRMLGFNLLLNRGEHLREALGVHVFELLVPLMLVKSLHQLVPRALSILRLAP